MAEQTFSARVDNMICPQCEDEIAAKLLFTRGVLDVSALYRKSRVTVRYDDAFLSESEITAALAGIGYPVGDGRAARRSDILCALGAAVLFVALPHLIAFVPRPAAPESTDALPLFLLGLASGVHCVGMCGGVALSQSAGKSRRSMVSASAAYNAGRVLGYAAMGALFGVLGAVMSYTPEFRRMVLTLCGLAVTVSAVWMWGIVPALRRIPPLSELFCRKKGKAFQSAAGQPLFVGLLTALMPCGSMSAVWLLAAAGGSARLGAIAMGAFALGTVPALALFGAAGSLLPARWNKYLLKASTAILLAMGLSLLCKGLR